MKAKFLTEAEAAQLVGWSKKGLANMRHKADPCGPPWFRAADGRAVLYDAESLREWTVEHPRKRPKPGARQLKVRDRAALRSLASARGVTPDELARVFGTTPERVAQVLRIAS